MISNNGLNSKEALDESTATNSSVTLSGIRREKEAPTDLDIENYSRNPRICDRRRGNAGLTADYPPSSSTARQARIQRIRRAGAYTPASSSRVDPCCRLPHC